MGDKLPVAAAAVGELVAEVHNDGERLLEVRLPATALPSDNIRELKKQLGDFMTDFMKQQNMDTGEDVDMLEEVVSDAEGEGSAKPMSGGKKAVGGKKRKQQEASKA